jgi:hypothetical protein
MFSGGRRDSVWKQVGVLSWLTYIEQRLDAGGVLCCLFDLSVRADQHA